MLVRLIRLVVFAISLLPLPLARGVGALVGLGAWFLNSRGAETTRANLAACFPDMEENSRRRLGRRSMKHWGMTLCEIPVVWRKGKQSLELVRAVEDNGILDRIADSTTGVIFLGPHLGNWELMGYWAANQGPMTTLYQPPRRFDLDALLVEARKKTGASMVPTNVRGVAQLVKALKRGEYVGILPDMEPTLSGGVFAPFFGVPALTMTLIHNLRQRTGALVVVCFARRVPGGFDLVLREPDAGIAGDSAEASAAAMNRAIEALVKLAPEQYQWEYKRFKRRPDGLAGLYK